MFGDEDTAGGDGMFNQGAPPVGRSNAPVVSNGLFGDAALKDDDVPASKKGNAGSKLNSIFDYEEDDGEEVKTPTPLQSSKSAAVGGFGGKSSPPAGLF